MCKHTASFWYFDQYTTGVENSSINRSKKKYFRHEGLIRKFHSKFSLIALTFQFVCLMRLSRQYQSRIGPMIFCKSTTMCRPQTCVCTCSDLLLEHCLSVTYIQLKVYLLQLDSVNCRSIVFLFHVKLEMSCVPLSEKLIGINMSDHFRTFLSRKPCRRDDRKFKPAFMSSKIRTHSYRNQYPPSHTHTHFQAGMYVQRHSI